MRKLLYLIPFFASYGFCVGLDLGGGAGGSGDMLVGTAQTITAAKTFSASTVFSSSISITNTGTSNGFGLRQIGNVGVTAGAFGTGTGGFYFDNTQNTGIGAHFYTDQASAAGLGVLVRMHCDNTSYAQPCLHIVQDGTSGAAANIRLDGPAPQLEFVEADQTTPAGKYELGVNGDLFYVDGRNAADNAFENIFRVARKGLGATNGHYVANMSTAAYRFYDADDSNYVAFKASDTITANLKFWLPAQDGTSGMPLVTNGSQVLSFSTSTSVGLFTATASLDFGATVAGACDSLTVNVPAAADGDAVFLGIPNALATADSYQSFWGFVSAANTVTVKRCNLTNITTALSNPSAATVRVDVWKH